MFPNRNSSALGFELVFLFSKPVWATKGSGGKDHLTHIHQEKGCGEKQIELGSRKLRYAP